MSSAKPPSGSPCTKERYVTPPRGVGDGKVPGWFRESSEKVRGEAEDEEVRGLSVELESLAMDATAAPLASLRLVHSRGSRDTMRQPLGDPAGDLLPHHPLT